MRYHHIIIICQSLFNGLARGLKAERRSGLAAVSDRWTKIAQPKKVRKNHIISEDITCQRLKKLAASLAIAAMAAGCGIIEHQPYPYKTSTKNPALGAWELVQTRMNSKFMPLYRVKTEEPNNILFVGKKQACHLSLYQIDGQKPDRQRQVGALEHRTGNQRSLVSAGLELNAIHRHGAPLNSGISVHYASLKKAIPNTAEDSC